MKMNESKTAPFGLAVVRIATGAMMLVGHGIPKVAEYSNYSISFPDPLGIGHQHSLWLVILSEVLGSACLILGVYPRVAALAGLISMMVAQVVHGNAPWHEHELASVYAVLFIAIATCGGGKFMLKE